MSKREVKQLFMNKWFITSIKTTCFNISLLIPIYVKITAYTNL